MEEFLRVLYKVVSFFGFLLLLGLATLTIYDFTDINNDINFDQLDLTNTGIVKRGYLLDAHLNCSNGFLGISVFKTRLYYKPLKPKIKEKYKAKQACQKRGFTPNETF